MKLVSQPSHKVHSLEDLINEMPEENIDGLIEHEKNNAPENKKEDK